MPLVAPAWLCRADDIALRHWKNVAIPPGPSGIIIGCGQVQTPIPGAVPPGCQKRASLRIPYFIFLLLSVIPARRGRQNLSQLFQPTLHWVPEACPDVGHHFASMSPGRTPNHRWQLDILLFHRFRNFALTLQQLGRRVSPVVVWYNLFKATTSAGLQDDVRRDCVGATISPNNSSVPCVMTSTF